jgi:hypothetical protein
MGEGIIGLATNNAGMIDLAYDVLGLEALFLVPRIFSLLSLNSYFGTLVSRIVSSSSLASAQQGVFLRIIPAMHCARSTVP